MKLKVKNPNLTTLNLVEDKFSDMVGEDLTLEVLEKVELVLLKLEQVFNTSFPRLNVGFGDFKKVAGWCKYSQQLIQFDVHFLKNNTEDMLTDTVPHEVCHWIQKLVYPNAKQAHGPEFRKLMNILGLKGKTYHSYDTSHIKKRKTKRFEYKTKCGEVIWLKSGRHNKSQAYINAGYNEYYYKTGKTGKPLYFTGNVETK